jgi:alkanesulfonate monooxygenase SsuD/methylene tetrahydromethanopterin reductase-like flavin-dependent oxidoreductase (luciferase family)
MQIALGPVGLQHHPNDPRTEIEIYQDIVSIAVQVERDGIDAIWTSEHHFADDYMSAQLPVLAAIASRTSTIGLGTGIIIGPFHDPLRLAEDCATVDLLSGGRLIVGLGSGYRPEEFDGFRVPFGERGRRLEATVTVLRQAWSSGLTRGDGVFYTYPDPGLNVTPKPARAEGPPIWLGGGAEAAIRRAGRIAAGYLSNDASPGTLATRVGWLREAAADAGRDPMSITVAIQLKVFVWEGPDAWECVRDAAHYLAWKYTDMVKARSSRERRLPPPLDRETEAALRAGMIVGSPTEVAQQLEQYRGALGPNGMVLARSYIPGLMPAVQRETLRLLGQEVVPRLRR